MNVLVVLQVVISVLLLISILMQKGQSGLGTVFGGSIAGEFRTKRGFEAFLFNASIFLGVLFVANSIALTIVSSSN